MGSGVALASAPAGEARGRDAEFVALRILHHSSAVPADPMLADDRGAELGQLVHRCRVWIHHVEVDPVLVPLGLGHLVEVSGRLPPPGIGSADGGKRLAAALVECATEHRRPEALDLEHVVAVEGDITEPGCHDILPGPVAGIVAPAAVGRNRELLEFGRLRVRAMLKA